MHCKADGSNVRNALCPAYLERWPDETPAPAEAPAPAAVVDTPPTSTVVADADPSAAEEPVLTVGYLQHDEEA